MDQDGAPGLVEQLESLGALYLWVVYHNYSALTQGKVVPRHRFREVADDGVSFANANWDFAITDDQLPHPGFGADSGDFRVVPDPRSLTPMPHRPGVVEAMGWLTEPSGRPWVGDPRARLQAATEALAGLGYSVRLGVEAEFVLAQRRPDQTWQPGDLARMFVIDAVDAGWELSARVLDTVEAAGITVHQFAKEYGPGQYEISLMPADPVTAVDRFLITRQLVKSLAHDAGLVASFMPKPWSDRPANGLHLHLSLVDQGGHEAIPDVHDPDGISRAGVAAIAGLLEHADGQSALGAPTSNSYRRLQPGSWAPAHRCWAFGNRAALVRIPSPGPGRHIEYRLGDASANPYLHAAGLIASIVDGIDRQLPLPAPAQVDVGHLTDAQALAAGFPRLPSGPLQALAALEADRVLLDVLGPVIADHYPRVKRYEFELGRRVSRTENDRDAAGVTDWERDAYLEAV